MANNESHPQKPYVNSIWYNNPQLSDVTIVYGIDGEKKFVGHRLVLCSASEWFMKASRNFKEASDGKIVLEGDHPEGVEALLEYAYNNAYTETVDDTDQLTCLQKQFQHRMHVFATADKYQVKGLVEVAYRHVRDLVDLYTVPRRTSNDGDKTTAPAFFRWMVEQVYMQGKLYFPALRNDSQKAKHEVEGASPINSETSQHNSTSSGYGSVSAVSQQNIPTLETTCNPSTQYSTEGRNSQHPLDRVQDLLVAGAVNAWINGHPYFNRKDLVPIVERIPDFGSDLAVAALKSKRIEGMPDCSEELDWSSPDSYSNNWHHIMRVPSPMDYEI
jgi:hypothetical protein